MSVIGTIIEAIPNPAVSIPQNAVRAKLEARGWILLAARWCPQGVAIYAKHGNRPWGVLGHTVEEALLWLARYAPDWERVSKTDNPRSA